MRNRCSIVLLLFLLVSCSHKEQNVENCFYQGSDSYQRKVTLAKEPQRIVSFSPAITEIIFLLNANQKLVGISDFCNYPPETAKITKVGKLLNINVENLLSLHPDLILIGSVISKEDVAKIEQANIPVFSVKQESKIENLCQTIETVGILVNRQNEADSLIDIYRQKIATFKAQKQNSGKKVYYVVGFGQTGDFTAPGNSYIHDIISLAGGDNIGKTLSTWNISREQLLQENPDYIFIREKDKAAFCKTYPYTELDAVKNKRVYAINSGWIDILSPRNFDAIEYIHRVINS
ncbi:MAG: ABC transporter substrate-binding protein [Bacteroidales bacterium]|nr:ABC transporter substrate-binding protein [Bacteroidales bacterium]